jgi:hypothetical protein
MSALAHRGTTNIHRTGKSRIVGAQGASIFIGCFARKAIKQTNRINDQLVALSRIPVGKLTVPKLVQQFPAMYGIKNIITLLTTRQWVLS